MVKNRRWGVFQGFPSTDYMKLKTQIVFIIIIIIVIHIEACDLKILIFVIIIITQNVADRPQIFMGGDSWGMEIAVS